MGIILVGGHHLTITTTLSWILMHTMIYVIGNLARTHGYISQADLLPGCYQNTTASDQCYFEAYVRKFVVEPLKMESSMFLPPAIVAPYCAPTENDTTWRHKVMQGQVHDENCFAMGGVSGHAGFFSTVTDLYTYMKQWMFAGPNDKILNSTTAAYFVKEYNNTQSSRALGWNTNDPTVTDQGWDLCCGTLSPKTFMHTGFTGTLLCGDIDRKVITILLTNRVYPTRNGPLIHDTRYNFNSVVQKIVDNL